LTLQPNPRCAGLPAQPTWSRTGASATAAPPASGRRRDDPMKGLLDAVKEDKKK
jgi:hypothetical protein